MNTETSKDLFLAILSMDSYNRGYGEGIAGLGGVGSFVGSAQITQQSGVAENDPERAAGFYALAYDIGAGGPDGLAGTTVISYRGTDEGLSELTGDDLDIINGNYNVDQQILAKQFFDQVSATGSVGALTGHSLGGSLGGFVAALTQTTDAHFLDPIGYGSSLENLGADFVRIGSYLGIASVNEAFSQYSLANEDNPNALTEGEFVSAWSVMTALGLDPDDPLSEFELRQFVRDTNGITATKLDPTVVDFFRYRSDLDPVPTALLADIFPNFGDVGVDIIRAHDTGLLVVLQYAEEDLRQQENGLAFQLVAKDLFEAFFDRNVAEAAGFKKVDGGRFQAEAIMGQALAYSALDGSEGLVFGNTGIRALFDDAFRDRTQSFQEYPERLAA